MSKRDEVIAAIDAAMCGQTVHLPTDIIRALPLGTFADEVEWCSTCGGMVAYSTKQISADDVGFVCTESDCDICHPGEQ